MIAVLVERGVLAWDTTIEEALPHLAKNMRADYREVTLEMLLANRGGIRHEWDVRGLWDILWRREGTPTDQRARMARAMLSEPPKVRPGSYFYSNCGYGIAGHIQSRPHGNEIPGSPDKFAIELTQGIAPMVAYPRSRHSPSEIDGAGLIFCTPRRPRFS